MIDASARRCLAFNGATLVAAGELTHVARAAKEAADRDPHAQLLFFDEVTSEPIEVDLRGTVDDVGRRVTSSSAGELTTKPAAEPAAEPGDSPPAPRGPGRPRLGVVAREVTLLPRHWEWLSEQAGGASVALRRLVDEARKANVELDRRRAAQTSAYRFLSAMAGDRPGFEEATRALFAGDAPRFGLLIADWPSDVRDHARTLAGASFSSGIDARPS